MRPKILCRIVARMTDHSYRKYSSLYGSGGSRGGARGGWPPLLLDQTEAQRAEKIFLETPPPYLRVWMTAPPPYLKVWIRHCMGHFG